MDKPDLKTRAVHEVVELLTVMILLAPFLVSFAIFRQYLQGTCGIHSFSYGTALATALVNALVLGKVILIGDIARIGKRSESKSLIVPTLYKAAMFTLFYLIVHVLEVTVESLFHGQTLIGSLRSAAPPGELTALSLVVFFAFIPFFALRETRRILGADKFHRLFLRRTAD